MKIVGIAGETGTGKSTIAAHLTMRGGVHIDADIVAHEILDGNESVRDQIRGRFGAEVFDATGRVDRRRLGALVFEDERLLDALNEIIHPLIRKECAARVDVLRSRGVPFVVIDAALLLNSKMPFRWDLMIGLKCDEGEQFERLMAKGGRSEKEVRRRMRSQRRIRDSLHKADVVVDTCRPKEEVLAEVDKLIDELLEIEIQ
jgi:dephospho-CoA kinase